MGNIGCESPVEKTGLVVLSLPKRDEVVSRPLEAMWLSFHLGNGLRYLANFSDTEEQLRSWPAVEELLELLPVFSQQVCDG